MDHTSFYKTKLPQTNFTSCSLAEADFTGADFKGSVFRDCDLRMAHFEQTNLEKADLSSSINIAMDPNKNQLKNAVFSMHNLPGLLAVYKIKIR
ncbi:Pentapeptide repeats (8 copies) [compost metagenome]